MPLKATNLSLTSFIPTIDEFIYYTLAEYLFDGYFETPWTGIFNFNQCGIVILNATTTPNEQGRIPTSGLYIKEFDNGDKWIGAKLLVVRKCLTRLRLTPCYSAGIIINSLLINRCFVMLSLIYSNNARCGFIELSPCNVALSLQLHVALQAQLLSYATPK